MQPNLSAGISGILASLLTYNLFPISVAVPNPDWTQYMSECTS